MSGSFYFRRQINPPLTSEIKIDIKYFKLKTRANRPKRRHLEWRDENRLSLRRERAPRMGQKSFPIPRGTIYQKYVCDRISRMAELEGGMR